MSLTTHADLTSSRGDSRSSSSESEQKYPARLGIVSVIVLHAAAGMRAAVMMRERVER